MYNPNRIPLSLRIVAFLFVLGGISAAIEVVVSMMNNHLNFNFGVLGLFIGLGLLKLSRAWRTCALVFLWIAMIAVPLIAVLLITHSAPLDVTLFGQNVGHAPAELGLAMAAAMFVVAVWQYRVLIRPDIRNLFGVPAG